MSASVFDMWIERISEDAVRSYFQSAEFKGMIRKHVRWAIQGYEPGFGSKDRQAFTESVAAYIRRHARNPVYLFGVRVWRKPPALEFCATEAERIVTDFLASEKVQFGDARYEWLDGADLAEADMDYWEQCP